jgi:hypothetical protein
MIAASDLSSALSCGNSIIARTDLTAFYEVLTQAMFAIGRREKFVVCKVGQRSQYAHRTIIHTSTMKPDIRGQGPKTIQMMK